MRDKLLIMATGLLCLVISACGGGGGGGSTSGGSGTTPPAPPPPLSVTLSSSSASLNTNDEQVGDVIRLEATVANAGTNSYVSDIQYDKNILTMTGSSNPSAGSYVATFALKNDLDVGAYSSTVTFRLCQDAACTQVVTNSSQTLSYTLDHSLQDWRTFQRFEDHKGYVPLTVDVNKISKVWEYNGTGYLTPVAATRSMIYVSSNDAAGGSYAASVSGLDATSGAVKWSYAIPGAHAISPPSLAKGKVVVTTTRPDQQSFVWVLDAATGALLSSTSIRADTSYTASPLAPTPYGDRIYVAAGIDTGTLYDVSTADGAIKWAAGQATSLRMTQAPTVDQDYVYYHDGAALKVYDRASGGLAYSIADPLAAGTPYRYDAAIVKGTYNNIIAFSGGGSGGSFNMFGSGLRNMVVYDLTAKAVVWRYNSKLLAAQPAIAGGVIYVGESPDNLVYAIDEKTFVMRWFNKVPDDSPASPLVAATQARFYGNMVATKNLLFLSTANKIRAISLSTHQVVWTYDSAGMMAIGPGNVLYITTAGFDYINGALISNRKIVALKLS